MTLNNLLAALATFLASFFIWRAAGFGWEISLVLAVPTAFALWAITARD